MRRLGLILLALFCVVVYAACKSSIPVPQAPLPPPDRPITLKNEDFEMWLEPAWVADHDEGSFGWDNPSSMEEIRVSVYVPKVSLDSAEMRRTAESLISIRRRTLVEESGGAVILTEPFTRARTDGFDVVFEGHDPRNPVEFYNILRANKNRLVSFFYIKYEPLLPRPEFEKRVAELSSRWSVVD